MVEKYSTKVMNKKEALRNDRVVIKGKNFGFSDKNVNKICMQMSENCKDVAAKYASITVDYYDNDNKIMDCIMQPCGDIYITGYDNGKAAQTVCVNPNCKEGILLTDDNTKKLSPSDERVLFAKKVSLASLSLWKGYVGGKYLTDIEKSKISAYNMADGRL